MPTTSKAYEASCRTYFQKTCRTSPHAIIGQLPPPPLMHNRSLVRDTTKHIHSRRDKSSMPHISFHRPNLHQGLHRSNKKTHIIPNTPVGPTACCSGLVPPQAAADLDSKKYVHSSWLAPTKPTDVSEVSRVGSQRREMMVDFRRWVLSPFLGFSLFSSPSSSLSSCLPCLPFLSSSSGSTTSSRLRLLGVEHGEPLV